MQRVVISGWPHLVNATEEEARTQRRVLASLGRFVAQSPATRKIAADAGGEGGRICTWRDESGNEVDAIARP